MYEVIYSLNDGLRTRSEHPTLAAARQAANRRASNAAATHRGVLSDSGIYIYDGSVGDKCVLRRVAMHTSQGSWELSGWLTNEEG